MAVDKNKAIIDFLLQCPAIANNPLFFNYITAKDDNKQIVTVANDTNFQKVYIDGSVGKQYVFTLIDFRSISANPLVKSSTYPNENVTELLEVQGIIDWVNEQSDIQNFPDFGPDCIIDEMITTSDNPALNSIDSTITPALAKYSITIRINYLDTSKAVWNRN